MTHAEILAAIAARPVDEPLADSVAHAAYATLLDLQRSAVPSSVRAGVLVEFGRVKAELLAALAEVEVR